MDPHRSVEDVLNESSFNLVLDIILQRYAPISDPQGSPSTSTKDFSNTERELPSSQRMRRVERDAEGFERNLNSYQRLFLPPLGQSTHPEKSIRMRFKNLDEGLRPRPFAGDNETEVVSWLMCEVFEVWQNTLQCCCDRLAEEQARPGFAGNAVPWAELSSKINEGIYTNHGPGYDETGKALTSKTDAHTGFRRDGRITARLLNREVKRKRVADSHFQALEEMIDKQTFQWRAHFPGHADPPNRILTQIWVQMIKTQQYIGELLSPDFVWYFRRNRPGQGQQGAEDVLYISKAYSLRDRYYQLSISQVLADLESSPPLRVVQLLDRAVATSALPELGLSGQPLRWVTGWARYCAERVVSHVQRWRGRLKTAELLRSNCITLWIGCRQPQTFTRVGREDEVLATLRTSTVAFPVHLGVGAVGDVHYSPMLGLVCKSFSENSFKEFDQERKMLEQAAKISSVVPRLIGAFHNFDGFCILQKYAGTSLSSWDCLSPVQLAELGRQLRSLHQHGIHHHDMRPENTVIGEDGSISLIDFHLAELVPQGELCVGCSDEDFLARWCHTSGAVSIASVGDVAVGVQGFVEASLDEGVGDEGSLAQSSDTSYAPSSARVGEEGVRDQGTGFTLRRSGIFDG